MTRRRLTSRIGASADCSRCDVPKKATRLRSRSSWFTATKRRSLGVARGPRAGASPEGFGFVKRLNRVVV
jgi:hypothetical protein